MGDAPVIVWFRNDLRVDDNAALWAAAATGAPVVAVFILDDEAAGSRAAGGASRWWLHHSLQALSARLERHGVTLVLKRGAAEDVLAQLQRQLGADRVEAHRAYEAWGRAQEERVRASLKNMGAQLHLHRGNLMFEPDTVATQAGEPFRVFTPYHRAVGRLRVSLPGGRVGTLPSAPAVAGEAIGDWGLLPKAPDWAGGLREAWKPGELGASARLEQFLEDGLAGYKDNRDRPDLPGTSRLSPHLRFGEIAPARVWQMAQGAAARKGASASTGLESFLRELVWREFSYHLLWYWPDLEANPFRGEFGQFGYRHDAAGLKAWQEGRTGYPIVDAGMRELWATGYMHNRVRMIVASFLTKDLLIDWREGERWFWDTLVDADPANNVVSWQWVAGCGADAAPYFRIYNPVKQGVTFDPGGSYVRRWVPELAKLPNDAIHAPWAAPELVLRSAGVELGRTYPLPLVDHALARQDALAAFARLKK